MDRLGVPLWVSLGSKSIAVLSPHSDDAAFSLSGLLHLAADRGYTCTIITAFSRSRRTRTGGIEPDEERVTAMRKREDQDFVSQLGAGARVLWCDLPDPSVRLPAARDTWYVPRPLSADERGFVAGIARFCEEHVADSSALLAPMALGRNRDHLIARTAALEFVRRSPRGLFFYEDLPYAARMSERDLERDVSDLAEAEGLALEPHTISYATLLLRKRRAVATYASQANRDIAGRVVRYALRVGKLVSAAERVWEVGFVGVGSHEREPDSAAQRART
jgi:LmbE family N-acetylglucosaminyl deacetylase